MQSDRPHAVPRQLVRCGAKLRRREGKCHGWAMPNGKCRMHGGKSLVGALSPAFKHGRFSRYLPQLRSIIESVKRGDILDLTDDIVVMSARIGDVLQRVDSGESGSLWEKAKGTFAQFRKAQAEDDRDKILASLNELNEVFERGVQDYQAWEEVKDLFLRRTKMVESQRKRAVENHEMLALSEVTEMMRAVTEALKRAVEKHVPEDEMRRLVFTEASSEIARLYGIEQHCGPTSKREH